MTEEEALKEIVKVFPLGLPTVFEDDLKKAIHKIYASLEGSKK